LVIALAVGWGIALHGFDGPLNGGWLTMRWLTGIVGLVGVAGVMTYPFRKEVYRRRAGALRYWMLAHIYLGTIAGVVLLMHAGSHTGGILTTVLYFTFDVVLLSGVVGMLTYLIVPRIMTRIEGDPLLIEDLMGRREELTAEKDEILKQSEGWLKEEIEQRIYPEFLSRSYLTRQFTRRESLKALLAEARAQYKDRTTRLATTEERELLLSAVETAVSLTRINALLLLHRSLRFWVPIHVISTALMLALMVVHICQVVFFKVR